jgi:hypothetical protein
MQHAYRTSDLAPDERVAVERLLGRELQNDEAVEVIIHKVAQMPAAQEAERAKAVARIRELARGKSLGGATVRDLL